MSPRIRRALGWMIGVVCVYISGRFACNRLADTLFSIDVAVHATVVSPSEKYKAIVFSRDCGVPCSFDNLVSVCVRNEDGLNDDDVVFISDIGNSSTESVGGYPLWVELKWLSDSRLLIRYAGGARVFGKKNMIAVDRSWFHGPKKISVDYEVK